MALVATIHKTELHIADNYRAYYGSYNLTVARTDNLNVYILDAEETAELAQLAARKMTLVTSHST